jgi:hypothetical protein
MMWEVRTCHADLGSAPGTGFGAKSARSCAAQNIIRGQRRAYCAR